MSEDLGYERLTYAGVSQDLGYERLTYAGVSEDLGYERLHVVKLGLVCQRHLASVTHYLVTWTNADSL